LIIPDEGYSLIDMDLARADMQVVAWDADNCRSEEQRLAKPSRLKPLFIRENEELHKAWEEGRPPDQTFDTHTNNAIDIFGKDVMGKGKDKKYRDLSKKIGHAADYLVTPRTAASQTGILVSEAERFIKRWLWINPEIPDWHRFLLAQLHSTRQVRNAFGYRRFFFGRTEDNGPEAVAWIPQSTIGLVINHALCNIDEKLRPLVMLLLQVHDSLTMQTPTEKLHEAIPLVREQSLIPIPYPNPLTIPVGFKVSDESWGRVKDYVRPT
jgi:DNA polymerase I-like protein with 3'-5' exonuclease and polymerase domains